MTIRMQHILLATCEVYGLLPSQLKGHWRKRQIARPRMIAMALCRELTTNSLPAIGRYFGGRDHTTVIHAKRRMAEVAERSERVALSMRVIKLLAEEKSRQPAPSVHGAPG